MPSRLPATPRDALSISPVLRFAANTVFLCADIFRSWKRPSKKAAADFEDMTLLDKMYWAYKSKKPVTRGERGMSTDEILQTPPIDKLPAGFKREHTLTFAAVGDLYKADGLEHSQDVLYEKTADLIFANDISYANLESQLTKQDISKVQFSEKEGPPICCTEAQFQAFKGHNGKKYTVMHTATNHTLDMGLEGVQTTLERLEKERIIDVGTNRQRAQYGQATIIEKKGIKIGFVSATYGLNGKPVPEGKEYLVNVVKFHPKEGPVDLSLLEKQIAHCKEQACDLVVASLHWGFEYEFIPRKEQVEIAHRIVEAGADLIIGHHAHVIQPLEYYRTRRDPARIAPIAYSLGNLTNPFSAPHLVLSAVLNLSIAKGTHIGQPKTYIEHAEIIPVVQRESAIENVPIIRLEKLADLLDQLKNGQLKADRKYISRIAKFANLVLYQKRHQAERH